MKTAKARVKVAGRDKHEKVGRPPLSPSGQRTKLVNILLAPETIRALDDYRSRRHLTGEEVPMPTRLEVIRRFIHQGLES